MNGGDLQLLTKVASSPDTLTAISDVLCLQFVVSLENVVIIMENRLIADHMKRAIALGIISLLVSAPHSMCACSCLCAL